MSDNSKTIEQSNDSTIETPDGFGDGIIDDSPTDGPETITTADILDEAPDGRARLSAAFAATGPAKGKESTPGPIEPKESTDEFFDRLNGHVAERVRNCRAMVVGVALGDVSLDSDVVFSQLTAAGVTIDDFRKDVETARRRIDALADFKRASEHRAAEAETNAELKAAIASAEEEDRRLEELHQKAWEPVEDLREKKARHAIEAVSLHGSANQTMQETNSPTLAARLQELDAEILNTSRKIAHARRNENEVAVSTYESELAAFEAERAALHEKLQDPGSFQLSIEKAAGVEYSDI